MFRCFYNAFCFPCCKPGQALEIDRTRKYAPVSPLIFTPRRSPNNGRKPQTQAVSLSQSGAKVNKINWPTPKTNQLWRLSSACQMSDHHPLVLSRKCLEPHIWSVLLNQSGAKWGKSTDHCQNLISFEGGQDSSACQISGHSYHAS